MMRTAIFPGSFDPFTIGHADLVARSLAVFDQLVVAVGVNADKHYTLPAEQRAETIRQLYASEPRISVVTYDDLTVDVALRVRARHIIKGVRNLSDFENERMQADANRSLTGIETLLLPTRPELSHVSSTLVRTLLSQGRDVSAYLPKPLHQTY